VRLLGLGLCASFSKGKARINDALLGGLNNERDRSGLYIIYVRITRPSCRV
jgi:hypothetical protein